MDTYTLEKILRRLAREYRNKTHKKVIYGVYPADYLIQTKIQKKKNKTSARAIIVNTDESFKPGAHWQALFIPAGDHSSKKKRRRCFFLIPMDGHQRVNISSTPNTPNMTSL